MTKGGQLQVRQEQIFGPILVRAVEGEGTVTDFEDEHERD